MIVLVTGTGTEVGKTWVTAAVARALRARGARVAARKPAQSFERGDTHTDADVLGAATGERASDVCPSHRSFPIAMAPPMAAEVLGRPGFSIADLADELEAPAGAITLVESAGGVMSPLASDGDTVAYAAAVSPAAVVVVADAGLGTLNSARLTVAALGGYRVVIYLNRFDGDDELHMRNRDWLVTRDGLEVVTDPEALAAFVVELAS